MYAQVVDVYTGDVGAIMRLGDMVAIPLDPANTDYQQYLAWLEAGNTPEPWEATNGPV